jgi:hypothetical protein
MYEVLLDLSRSSAPKPIDFLHVQHIMSPAQPNLGSLKSIRLVTCVGYCDRSNLSESVPPASITYLPEQLLPRQSF